jgi:nitrogen-specific signal transduction histidine kinase/CheY-like chemotaxis protein
MVECTMDNLLDNPAVGAVVVNWRDITERLQLEEKLQRAQRMDSIGRLAGGIAHDFNNLLTAILGNAETMSIDGVNGDELDAIKHAALRGADLTRQLLDFARPKRASETPFDVNALLQNSERLLRRLLGEEVILSTEYAAGLAAVRGDEAQLEQVIVNLCVNARDAMPIGGQLRLTTTLQPKAPFTCRRGNGEGWVMLSVEDTGTGMTSEVLSRIFEPFFTTKELGRGTGLGLATSYSLVQQFGGQILVRSEPGVGSRFDVWLPLDTGEMQARGGPTLTRVLACGSEHVLLVEDEVSTRAVTRRALEKLGYRVTEAADGLRALSLLAAPDCDIQVILSDISMPGMTGPQLIHTIRAARRTLPVLLVSGYSNGSAPETPPGGVQVLQKPWSIEELSWAVRITIRGETSTEIDTPLVEDVPRI